MTTKRVFLLTIIVLLAALRPNRLSMAQGTGKDQVLASINAALTSANTAFYAKFKTPDEWTKDISEALTNYAAALDLVNANLSSPDFAQEPDKTTLLTLDYRALAGKGRTQARQFQVMSTPYLYDNSGANMPQQLATYSEADTQEARANLAAAAKLGESFSKAPIELEYVYTTWAAVLHPKLPYNALFFILTNTGSTADKNDIYLAYQLLGKAHDLFDILIKPSSTGGANGPYNQVYGALSDQGFIANDLSREARDAPDKLAAGRTEVQWWITQIDRQRDQAAYLMSAGRDGSGYYNANAEAYSQALQDHRIQDPDGMTLAQWLQDQIKYGSIKGLNNFQVLAQERLAWLTQDVALARTAADNEALISSYTFSPDRAFTPGKNGGNYDYNYVLIGHNLGKMNLLLGNPVQALADFQAIKNIIDSDGKSIYQFNSSDLVGELLSSQTRFENEWLLGRSYVLVGRFIDALTQLQSLITLIPNYKTNSLYPGSQYDIGRAYIGLNRYNEAVLPLETGRSGYQDQLNAATIAKDADQIRSTRIGLIDDTLSLSLPLAVLGRTEEAVTTLQQALDEANKQDDPALKVNTTLRVGDIYLQLQKDDEALKNYQAAADLASTAKLPQQQGRALLGIGQILTKRGQIDDARKALTQASAAAKAANDSASQVQASDALGDLALQGSKPDAKSAQSFYSQALAVAVSSKDPRLPIQPLTSLGDIQVGSTPTSAQFTYYKALSAALQIDDREAQARLYSRLGALAAGSHDLFTADAAYQDAIHVIEQTQRGFKSQTLTSQFAANYAQVYAEYIKLLVSQQRYADAFAVSEQARARAFLDQLAGGPVDYRQGSAADLLQKANDLRVQIDTLHQLQFQVQADTQSPSASQKATLSQLQLNLQDLEQQYADVFTRLQAQSPQLKSLSTVETLQLPHAQAMLDVDTTLLSYYVVDNTTFAFVITHDKFSVITLPVNQTDLDKFVRQFRANEKQADGLDSLSSAIITPLLDQLKTTKVLVVPHNVLNYIPFAALPTPDKMLFGDKFLVSYLPSVSSLAYLNKTPAQPGSLFAFGNPTANGVPALPYAADEVNGAVGVMGGKAYLGSDATLATFQQVAPQSGILYIAAHGTFNTINPLFSALHLATTADSSGLLQAYQVYSLDLSKQTQLVVLSACDTAVGTLSPGDEFTGLNRAFLYAGAPAVIATLWSVDDKATGLLMKDFFQQRSKGQSAAQALQGAQAYLRTYQENGQTPYSSPYYWAAFILSSAPGN